MEAEGVFLGQLIALGLVGSLIVMLTWLVKDIATASFEGIRFILNPKNSRDQRKQQALNGLGWLAWTLGALTALYQHPAWMTLFIIAGFLQLVALFNARRLRSKKRTREALEWIRS
ncbi:MAG TPA: hypothetical protein VFK94_01180 [Patescibacteria group bacterium]|nr:hypothetical protein [Patescibacteria group bacterium]